MLLDKRYHYSFLVRLKKNINSNLGIGGITIAIAGFMVLRRADETKKKKVVLSFKTQEQGYNSYVMEQILWCCIVVDIPRLTVNSGAPSPGSKKSRFEWNVYPTAAAFLVRNRTNI